MAFGAPFSNEKKAQCALQTTVGTKQDTSSSLKLAVGSYSGNVSTSGYSASGSQTISVGFKPKAVLVVPRSGNFYSSDGSGHVYGGLSVTDHSGTFSGQATVEITSSGFQVHTYRSSSVYYSIELNNEGKNYHYIALG